MMIAEQQMSIHHVAEVLLSCKMAHWAHAFPEYL
jgi:hypothetical protein